MLSADDEEALVSVAERFVAEVAGEHVGELAGVDEIWRGWGKKRVGGAEGDEKEDGEKSDDRIDFREMHRGLIEVGWCVCFESIEVSLFCVYLKRSRIQGIELTSFPGT